MPAYDRRRASVDEIPVVHAVKVLEIGFKNAFSRLGVAFFITSHEQEQRDQSFLVCIGKKEALYVF